MVTGLPRTRGIEQGLAFDEDDCRRVISEAWSRYTGQPASTQSSAQNPRAPGFFGLTQRRRWHLFKLPWADPVLPDVLGEYPHFQSDLLRQKHWELVSRLTENRFTVDCTAAADTEKSREMADQAEWVLTYGTTSIQERTAVDWQKALAEAVSAYGVGYIHWRIAPELTAAIPEAEYRDNVPDDRKSRFRPTHESIDGDTSKGRYRETADSVAKRAALAKARAPFPIHVEICAPDQVAVIEDESYLPGPGLLVHIKEVGIIDYNGKLAKDGLRLVPQAINNGQSIKLSMEEFDPATKVGLERPAPSGTWSPSIAGWKQRIAIAYVWTRDECYELASPTLLSSGNDMLVNDTGWLLVKGWSHGYGRVPYARAYATVEQNEWDPALRYQPALAGLYASKPSYDYARALEMRIATEHAIQKYFITAEPGSPPPLEGDEEGDQVVLSRDSAQAQSLPIGTDLKAVPTPDINPAFIRDREIQGKEYEDSSPPTGHAEITATTQPWNIRLGQAQENAYPADLLLSIAKCLAEMIRNWVEVAQKPVEEGGLGVTLCVPGKREGTNGKYDMSQAIEMQPDDWDGIWVDVEIDPVSAAERVTQTQMSLQLLNNPIHVSTPEMMVDDMGVQDATGHMQDVDAYWALAPWKDKLVQQELAKYYGSRVVMGADGMAVNAQGQQMTPEQVLAQNGVRPAPPPQAPGPQPPGSPIPIPQGMQGSPQMPGLSPLVGNGAAPVAGIPAVNGSAP